MSNAWIICPEVRDNNGKLLLISDVTARSKGASSMLPLSDESASYQLVGKVMAYQGSDG